MLRLFIYILTPFLLSTAFVDHDIHVSINEIDVDNNYVEITIKTFLDDLQSAIGLTPGEEIPDDYTSSDELIDTYLQKSIVLKINEEPVSLTVSNISASSDAVWITLNTQKMDLSLIKKISLDNAFLIEVHDDQTNVVKINWNDKITSELLNKNKTSFTIEL